MAEDIRINPVTDAALMLTCAAMGLVLAVGIASHGFTETMQSFFDVCRGALLTAVLTKLAEEWRASREFLAEAEKEERETE